jgi:hypothetical protein
VMLAGFAALGAAAAIIRSDPKAGLRKVPATPLAPQISRGA